MRFLDFVILVAFVLAASVDFNIVAQEASKFALSHHAHHFHRIIYTAITSSPQSVNTTLTRVAIFNCTYVGDALRWRINGQKIFDNHNGFSVVPVSHSFISTLSVVTSLDKNNTNITCTAISADLSFDESEPALLLLQGTHTFHVLCDG